MKRREFFGTLGLTGLLATAALDRLRLHGNGRRQSKLADLQPSRWAFLDATNR